MLALYISDVFAALAVSLLWEYSVLREVTLLNVAVAYIWIRVILWFNGKQERRQQQQEKGQRGEEERKASSVECK